MTEQSSSFDEAGFAAAFGNADNKLSQMELRFRDLERSAHAFARTMTGAFTASIVGARSFDDVLKGLYLRLSSLALQLAFKPLERQITSSLTDLFSGMFGVAKPSASAAGPVKTFAAGGVIGTPTYFPLSSGGLGLAGEAGPEAILPLTRTADGRLGVAAAGGASPASIVVNIATPDVESFRRSDVYVTGQIARAVARGQRGL